ncbi:hypothetical protein FAZ78_06370 [Cereibacter changlensis]|uniref:Uncharacterized protein n=1 Tax=Cereibacter changlensis TaxID=402884 RepID=A0A4V5NLX4_9RHOB|nr:hypothetical protein FAZ78_06370 [Cereibacter changlensis]
MNPNAKKSAAAEVAKSNRLDFLLPVRSIINIAVIVAIVLIRAPRRGDIKKAKNIRMHRKPALELILPEIIIYDVKNTPRAESDTIRPGSPSRMRPSSEYKTFIWYNVAEVKLSKSMPYRLHVRNDRKAPVADRTATAVRMVFNLELDGSTGDGAGETRLE